MKRLITLSGFLLLVGLTYPGFTEGNTAKIKADHLSMVKKYEGLAKDQQKIADEHVKMKKEYVAKYWINEKLSPKLQIQEMENHCDKIIEEALKQKEHFLMMTEFHKSLAAELDKK